MISAGVTVMALSDSVEGTTGSITAPTQLVDATSSLGQEGLGDMEDFFAAVENAGRAERLGIAIDGAAPLGASRTHLALAKRAGAPGTACRMSGRGLAVVR
jgi:hypothetical protein